MEEVNELFVMENKLNLTVADANTLPTISITKVTHRSSIQATFFCHTANGQGGQYWTWQRAAYDELINIPHCLDPIMVCSICSVSLFICVFKIRREKKSNTSIFSLLFILGCVCNMFSQTILVWFSELVKKIDNK